eukprot:g77452.t1
MGMEGVPRWWFKVLGRLRLSQNLNGNLKFFSKSVLTKSYHRDRPSYRTKPSLFRSVEIHANRLMLHVCMYRRFYRMSFARRVLAMRRRQQDKAGKSLVQKDQKDQKDRQATEIAAPVLGSESHDALSAQAYWLALVVFCAVLAVYLATAYPSNSGGDSGELTVAACNWGVAHPPGYPTYTMLAGLATRLLSGTRAYRINMMNCVLGACAAALLSLTASRLARGVSWAGLASAAWFAFNPTVWLYSTQGEVFALNNALCSLMAFLLAQYYAVDAREKALDVPDTESENKGQVQTCKRLCGSATGLVCLGAFVCGLAMTNQHTTVFYVLATALSVTFSLYARSKLSAVLVVALVSCVVLGMTPYIYMVVSAHMQAMDSWGDQRTLAGFLHHFLRREYGTFQLAADSIGNDPGMRARLLIYLKVLLEESLYAPPVLAIFGLFWLLLERPRSWRVACTATMLASYLLYVAVFHYLANLDLKPLFLGVQARFWMQANLYVFLWAGLGLEYLSVTVWRLFVSRLSSSSSSVSTSSTSSSTSLPPSDKASWLWPGNLACCGLGVMFAGLQLGLHYGQLDHSDMWGFHTQGEVQLRAFPKDSIVLLNGDLNNNVIKYMQQCEGIRPDLRLLSVQLMTWDWFVPMQSHHYPGVVFPGNKYHPWQPGDFSILQFLEKNFRKFSIFLCGPWKEGDETWREGFTTVPFGLCERIFRKGKEPKNWTDYTMRSLKGLPIYKDLPAWQPGKYGPETWEHVLYSDIWMRHQYIMSYTSFMSNKNLSDIPLLRLAKKMADDLFVPEMEHVLRASDYRAGGIIYGQYSEVLKKEKREDEFRSATRSMMALWKRYLNLTRDQGQSSEEATQIAAFVDGKFNPYSGTHVSQEDMP